MLVVQPLTKTCEPKGDPIICADSTCMAGPDELVYYEGGREAAMALRETFVPVDHAIVGIVDDVNLSTSGFQPDKQHTDVRLESLTYIAHVRRPGNR